MWWGTRRQLMNLCGALALVGALSGLAFGLPAIDRALPSQRSIRTDRPYPIGGRVSVLPPAGATIDLTGTRPGADRGTVLFRLGPVPDGAHGLAPMRSIRRCWVTPRPTSTRQKLSYSTG